MYIHHWHTVEEVVVAKFVSDIKGGNKKLKWLNCYNFTSKYQNKKKNVYLVQTIVHLDGIDE